MAFTTLTNPKTIMGLGPNRSILGTIIRPDSVLVERKGGSNGQVTFDSLLPGAGEPLQSQCGQHELLGNWQLDDEEPLPRGGNIDGNINGHSSGKKRKASAKDKSGKKKVKENGEASSSRHRENGSRKEKIVNKKHHGNNRDDPNGYGRSISPWSH